MTYLRRAAISIKRNLGKTILLFLIVLILGSVISGAISTNRATENMESNLIDSMLPLAIIQFDWELFQEYNEDPDRFFSDLSPELIRQIGALPYVRSYDFYTHTWLFTHLEEVQPDMDDNIVIDGGWRPDEDAFGRQVRVRGVENPNLIDIEQNLLELVSGRVFTRDEIRSFSAVAVVSEEFAQLNNLHVGSTFTLRNVIFEMGREIMWGGDDLIDNVFAEQSYEMEVIGIFRPLNLQIMDDDFMNAWMVTEIQNRIYVPNTFVEAARRFEFDSLLEQDPDIFGDFDPDDFMMWENFFTLYDPNDFPAFREGVMEIVPPYFKIVDTANSFMPVLSALDTMKGLTMMVLYIAIGASLLIITLLISLFLRDRRREVGIYLALGERKRKIVSQFLLEIIGVAFLSIVVALFIGNIIATNLSESMLMNDIALEQQRAGEIADPWGDPFANMGFRTEVPPEVIADSYDVSLDFITILLFFGVGLGTVLFATVIPMIYVLRLNPKKIML